MNVLIGTNEEQGHGKSWELDIISKIKSNNVINSHISIYDSDKETYVFFDYNHYC